MAEARTALVQAAQAMAVDELTAEVVVAFDGEGIESILLKGPSIARWLYPDGTRPYGDADLLVNPSQFSAAIDVLKRLGFGSPSRAPAEHAQTWHRRDGSGAVLCVDLHRTIPMVTASPDALWRAFARETESIQVGRIDVRILAIPPRLFHIAMHAVQHAWETKSPQEDLRRAIAAADFEDWRAAADLSRELGAEDALAAGLCLVPEGEALAAALHLTSSRRGTLRMAANTQTDHASYTAFQLQRLIDAGSLRERIKLMVNPLLVSPSTLREHSALARRGRAGLVLGYAARPIVLARRFGPALLARRRILKRDA